MINRAMNWVLQIILFVLVLEGASCASVVKLKTGGTYVDGSGTAHAWTINDCHTLIWDGKPYVPVGVVFCPLSLRPRAGEHELAGDTAVIEFLKEKGITDLIISSSGPVSSSDPVVFQKLVDYLEAAGFAYGIDLHDVPVTPLKGYLISPARYRLEGPNPQTKIVCDWADIDSAIYVIARKSDNSIKSIGGAVVRDGKVNINLSEPLSSGEVLIVYPRKTFESAPGGPVGDLWTGFGEYRDRLVGFLEKIKFGPGLRFFLDPFICQTDIASETVEFLPDSQGFRVGLEAFLTKRYTHEGGVNTAWGFVDLVGSIEEATRVIPLWAKGRGIGYAYDRASAKLYSVNTLTSQLWRDVVDYRDTSIQEYMNAIADVLRKQVADVPVIFTCAGYHRVYANPYGMGGYSGLAALTAGLGESAILERVGPAYALAEESAKTTWFLVVDKTAVSQRGLDVTESVFETSCEIGCKGFFVGRFDAAKLSDGEDQISPSSGLALLSDRLKEFKQKLGTDQLAQFKPTVVSYPVVPSVGAYVKRLGRNVWWLPSLRVGVSSYIGDGLFAYSFVGEDRTYMWSSIGAQNITLKSGPTGYPKVEFPERVSIAKKKGDQFTVTLTDVPVVLRGIDVKLVFPYETALLEMDRLADVIAEADKVGFDVKNARQALESAKTVIQKGSPLTAYGMAQQNLLELMNLLGGDLWFEAELTSTHSFDGVAAMPGASGNLVLLLDTNEDSPLSAFTATFAVDVPLNSSYEIWLAGTPPTEGSSVSYSVDDAGWQKVSAGADIQRYASELAWYKIGTTNLLPGRHTVSLRVDGRRASDGRYYFAVDALVLSPRGFKPKGITKPF
ncbi:MAG: hypothetical protein ACUVRS_06405 [Armatimonadota bacterium]